MTLQTLVFALMIVFTGSIAMATPDLGTTPKDTKTNDHVSMNPGTPDGRQGGEDIGSAVVIDAIPFSDTGNTTDNLDDYEEVCPYPSTSPDVVYSYSPAADTAVSVDLCGSGYDTKTYIYDSAMNLVACNDDFYFGDPCGSYVSFIEEALLVAGETYYFVVDGYGSDSGDYIIDIQEVVPEPPCIIDCASDDEGEPALVDGYEDAFNGGCNSPEFGYPFSTFEADEYGELTFCGVAGWYISSSGGETRDTDWYLATVGEAGIIEWTLDAEYESYGYFLGPPDCAIPSVVDQIMVGPCNPQTMTIQGSPGDIMWLMVGASTLLGPVNEYPYLCIFTGLEAGSVATESVSFDGIKSLYR